MATPELRRFPRFPTQTTLLVESLDPDGPEELARTRSVSLGGVGFLSPRPLDEDTPLQILIAVGPEVVRARGRVVYSLAGSNGHEVGVEFVQITPADEEVLQRLLERSPEPGGTG